MRIDAVVLVDLWDLMGPDLGIVVVPVLVLVPESGLEMVSAQVPLEWLDFLRAL